MDPPQPLRTRLHRRKDRPQPSRRRCYAADTRSLPLRTGDRAMHADPHPRCPLDHRGPWSPRVRTGALFAKLLRDRALPWQPRSRRPRHAVQTRHRSPEERRRRHRGRAFPRCPSHRRVDRALRARRRQGAEAPGSRLDLRAVRSRARACDRCARRCRHRARARARRRRSAASQARRDRGRTLRGHRRVPGGRHRPAWRRCAADAAAHRCDAARSSGARASRPRVSAALSSQKLPKSRVRGATFRAEDWVERLDDRITPLEKAIDVVAREVREAEGTQATKNRALEAYDETFRKVATLLSATLSIAGEDELASRVRPTARRPGRTAGSEADSGEEPANPVAPALSQLEPSV